MYVASPALRGDAGSTSEVLPGLPLPGLPLALLSEETLAYQLEMRERSTARASAEQLRCKTARKLAPATRSE